MKTITINETSEDNHLQPEIREILARKEWNVCLEKRKTNRDFRRKGNRREQDTIRTEQGKSKKTKENNKENE